MYGGNFGGHRDDLRHYCAAAEWGLGNLCPRHRNDYVHGPARGYYLPAPARWHYGSAPARWHNGPAPARRNGRFALWRRYASAQRRRVHASRWLRRPRSSFGYGYGLDRHHSGSGIEP